MELRALREECAQWRQACLELRRNIAVLTREIDTLKIDNDRLRDSEIKLREALSATLEELQIMEEVLQEAHEEIGPPPVASPDAVAAPAEPREGGKFALERQRSRVLQQQSRELRERLSACPHEDVK